MEEDKNQEGDVLKNQNAPSDNNSDANAAAPAEELMAENKPEELVVEEMVVEVQTVEPVEQQPSAGAAAETAVSETNQPAIFAQPDNKPLEAGPALEKKEPEPEIKAQPLPAIGDADNKNGGIVWKIIFIIIIILVVFLLVKFFSNKGTGINVLDTIANVNVKVSNEQEKGKVNIVAEDSRKLNDKVSEQAANQPQLTPTPASGAATASTTKIIAYYPNSMKNPGAADCSKVFPLERNAEKKYDSDVINTIRGLLTTLTPEEKDQGFITNIPVGTMLKTVKVSDKGVAEVNFTASLNNIGGSCAVSAARAQIEQTMKQFPQVKSVLICVDGNCQQDEILQP